VSPLSVVNKRDEHPELRCSNQGSWNSVWRHLWFGTKEPDWRYNLPCRGDSPPSLDRRVADFKLALATSFGLVYLTSLWEIQTESSRIDDSKCWLLW